MLSTFNKSLNSDSLPQSSSRLHGVGYRSRLALFLCSSVLGACVSDAANAPPGDSLVPPAEVATSQSAPPAVSSYTSGLQSSGALGVATALPGGAGTAIFELSAPILPNVADVYSHQGASYPPDPADEQALVLNAALTFDFLLTYCAATHPAITLPTTTAPLTRAQLDTNYLEVAKCAYDFGSKPVWIPMMIHDVSICELAIGPEWHLLSQSDLASFTADDYRLFAELLPAGDSLAKYYFALDVYVRGSDGRLKLGKLVPGGDLSLQDIADTELDQKVNLTPYLPRCIRRMLVP
jgi:hypothetical protein